MSAKILVVEDEKILAMGLKRKLEIMGYTVIGTASSGREAVEMAGGGLPDLVLMDIVLKGDLDGIDAAQQIINLYNIPIIYITAYADEKILERAMVTEPYGYLIKPFKETELRATIKMALYKHKAEFKRIEYIKKRLMDDYNQFIFKNINESIDKTKTKEILFRALEKSFEEKMQTDFYKELENKGLDLSTDDEYVLFETYASWISKFFSYLGIKNKLTSDHEKYYFQLFNCPWISHSVKNSIFCINCNAMISCSFKWINLKGEINKTSTIAEDSPKCTFIIH